MVIVLVLVLVVVFPIQFYSLENLRTYFLPAQTFFRNLVSAHNRSVAIVSHICSPFQTLRYIVTTEQFIQYPDKHCH